MKNEQNHGILHNICPKILFPNFGQQFPGLKLRVSELDLNAIYVTMVDIVLQAQSLLKKPFKRLLMLIYSISLDA